jgi:hypothetical protein
LIEHINRVGITFYEKKMLWNSRTWYWVTIVFAPSIYSKSSFLVVK